MSESLRDAMSDDDLQLIAGVAGIPAEKVKVIVGLAEKRLSEWLVSRPITDTQIEAGARVLFGVMWPTATEIAKNDYRARARCVLEAARGKGET